MKVIVVVKHNYGSRNSPSKYQKRLSDFIHLRPLASYLETNNLRETQI